MTGPRREQMAETFEIRRKPNAPGAYEVFIDGEYVPWHIDSRGLEVEYTEAPSLKFVTVRLMVSGDVTLDPDLKVTRLGEGRHQVEKS